MAEDALTRASTCPDAEAVALELNWLEQVIAARQAHYFNSPRGAWTLPPPPETDRGTILGSLIREAGLAPGDRLILALGLAPHVQPALLDAFFVRNTALDRSFTIFGGVPGRTGAFQPTGETALFLLAGDELPARMAAMARLAPDAPLRAEAGLSLGSSAATGETGTFAGPLLVRADRVLELCTGTAPRPDHGADFPAKLLRSGLDWGDLALPNETRDEVDHILGWLENEDRIMGDWGLGSRLMPGFRALFHGPPGTGKSLTAALLGKRSGRDVYRIDLSMIVSKYIGETEKNLAGVFDLARRKNWILFFDEADALFGARTQASSSNDRFANQEVSYLLQRVEETPGLVILATNLKGNIDDAFFRRFQSSVGFVRPDTEQRIKLWKVALGDRVPLSEDVDIQHLARDHDLSGAAIVNVVRHAAITALRRGARTVSMGDLRAGIASELRKEGRTV